MVKRFHAEREAMPWLNAYSEGEFDSAAAKAFQVAGIPKVFLVDEDGKIVATERDLRGEELIETLTRHLGNSKGGSDR